MNIKINIKAYPGDKVWIALKGGPYRALITEVKTTINHWDTISCDGTTTYFYKTEDGKYLHACSQAVCLTKKEAQERLDCIENEERQGTLGIFVIKEEMRERIHYGPADEDE